MGGYIEKFVHLIFSPASQPASQQSSVLNGADEVGREWRVLGEGVRGGGGGSEGGRGGPFGNSPPDF